MALDLETIGVAFDTTGLEKGTRAFKDNEQAANRAADAADKMGKDTESTFSMVRRAVVALSGVIASIKMGGAFAKITSEMTDYEARLARVVGGTDAASAAMDSLHKMARRTYSDFGLTVESYLQNEGALRAMGYTTKQTMAYVETLNNALVVSGAKAERAASVQYALQKAMALGKLSGDQLNTVISTGGWLGTIFPSSPMRWWRCW